MTWLPNQLFAVLDAMVECWEKGDKKLPGCEDIMEAATAQRDTLTKEVEKYCQERNVEPPRKSAA